MRRSLLRQTINLDQTDSGALFASGVKVTPLGKVPVKLKVDLGTEFRVVIVKVFGCSHDKSSVVHARDARRSCDSDGEIPGPGISD